MVSCRSVVLLGSTGSIGTQALDVVRRNPDRFRIVGLAAGGRDPQALAAQVAEFRPEVVAVGRPEAVAAVRDAVGPGVRVLGGPEGVEQIAAHPCDVVLNGLDGALGLPATLAALHAGTTLALANKESLIVGGPLVKRAARPGQIVPVDSEHSALAQALRGGTAAEVRRLVVTATGGPFRGRSRASLADVTPEQALKHPRWSMGPVVSTNSATLVNKGLEVIEAHLLFDVPFDDIEVMVHPQAIIHSMVEFTDGSTIAQVGLPDMRLPIALGMAWPDRVPDAVPGLDWTAAHTWTGRRSRRSTWPRTWAGSAAARRRCSTRPTRCACTRSWPGGCRSWRSWTPCSGWWTSRPRPRPARSRRSSPPTPGPAPAPAS
jgi:1-deoxy-D-xylulose-5-phosphate reductoisomerase